VLGRAAWLTGLLDRPEAIQPADLGGMFDTVKREP
jgi:hypothetical protein